VPASFSSVGEPHCSSWSSSSNGKCEQQCGRHQSGALGSSLPNFVCELQCLRPRALDHQNMAAVMEEMERSKMALEDGSRMRDAMAVVAESLSVSNLSTSLGSCVSARTSATRSPVSLTSLHEGRAPSISSGPSPADVPSPMALCCARSSSSSHVGTPSVAGRAAAMTTTECMMHALPPQSLRQRLKGSDCATHPCGPGSALTACRRRGERSLPSHARRSRGRIAPTSSGDRERAAALALARMQSPGLSPSREALGKMAWQSPSNGRKLYSGGDALRSRHVATTERSAPLPRKREHFTRHSGGGKADVRLIEAQQLFSMMLRPGLDASSTTSEFPELSRVRSSPHEGRAHSMPQASSSVAPKEASTFSNVDRSVAWHVSCPGEVSPLKPLNGCMPRFPAACSRSSPERTSVHSGIGARSAQDPMEAQVNVMEFGRDSDHQPMVAKAGKGILEISTEFEVAAEAAARDAAEGATEDVLCCHPSSILPATSSLDICAASACRVLRVYGVKDSPCLATICC